MCPKLTQVSVTMLVLSSENAVSNGVDIEWF